MDQAKLILIARENAFTIWLVLKKVLARSTHKETCLQRIITVSQEDIDQGIPGTTDNPISRALMRQLADAGLKYVEVTSGYMVFNFFDPLSCPEAPTIRLADHIRSWLNTWETNPNRVSPISFGVIIDNKYIAKVIA